MEKSVRKAWVAGKFYPSTVAGIDEMFGKLRNREKAAINFELSGKRILGAVLPHAGHIYSGYQTIHFFEILAASKQEPETFVIIHPIHRGGEIDFATDENIAWRTPLGDVPLDNAFIDAMQIPRSGNLLQGEHSAEVILPFIQKYSAKNIHIVPIGMARQNPDTSKGVSEMIAKAVRETGRRICVIASSDFSHYLDPLSGRKKDQMVLEHIIGMEPDKIYNTVRKNDISVCGYGPIMALMYYTRFIANEVEAMVLSRGHSGEVYPSDSVVDYISILFYDES